MSTNETKWKVSSTSNSVITDDPQPILIASCNNHSSGRQHAEFIVRAVNSHAELVKVLIGVLHHDSATKSEYQLPQSLIAHIERALTKARGEAA